jgi:hypothetical protein
MITMLSCVLCVITTSLLFFIFLYVQALNNNLELQRLLEEQGKELDEGMAKLNELIDSQIPSQEDSILLSQLYNPGKN